MIIQPHFVTKPRFEGLYGPPLYLYLLPRKRKAALSKCGTAPGAREACGDG